MDDAKSHNRFNELLKLRRWVALERMRVHKMVEYFLYLDLWEKELAN